MTTTLTWRATAPQGKYAQRGKKQLKTHAGPWPLRVWLRPDHLRIDTANQLVTWEIPIDGSEATTREVTEDFVKLILENSRATISLDGAGGALRVDDVVTPSRLARHDYVPTLSEDAFDDDAISPALTDALARALAWGPTAWGVFTVPERSELQVIASNALGVLVTRLRPSSTPEQLAGALPTPEQFASALPKFVTHPLVELRGAVAHPATRSGFVAGCLHTRERGLDCRAAVLEASPDLAAAAQLVGGGPSRRPREGALNHEDLPRPLRRFFKGLAITELESPIGRAFEAKLAPDLALFADVMRS